MWSIYDTMILATGIIVAVIAIVPVAQVPAATRGWSALIGGALIVAALALGNLRSFRYPSFVFIAPVIALLVLGAVVADAKKRARPAAGLQFDDQAHGELLAPPALGLPAEAPATTIDAEPAPAVLAVEPADVPLPPDEADLASPERNAAWIAVNDPTTPAALLAELVGEYPEFAATVATHPQCYPELRQWIADYVSPAR